MIRQGDVLLRRVEALPPKATRIRREGPAVLARGEAARHAHVLDEAAALFQEDRRLYVVLGRETPLTHNDHAPVTVEPGVLEVLRQREYDPRGSVHVRD